MAKKQNNIKFCLWTHIQNEASIIEDMIESAVDYVDYIVLVDNGSTDGTQDIVRNYFKKIDVPAVLYENPNGWTNPGVNRQQAWDYLCQTDHKCDYILRIDADEIIKIDDSFDWTFFEKQNPDSYDVIFSNGGYCIPRTWIWNFHVKWKWRDDEAHEEIVLDVDNVEDEESYSRVILPYSFRHEAGKGAGHSHENPVKYHEDVLKFELQMLRRLQEGSNIHRERYYLFYLCRSFNYGAHDIDEEHAYDLFPYGKHDVIQFLKKGIYYYERFIDTFVHRPDWFIFYFKSQLHERLHDYEGQIKLLERSYNDNPLRAEPIHDLFWAAKRSENLTSAIKWGRLLKAKKLDIERDPYDVETYKYYEHNASLRAAVDEVLINEPPPPCRTFKFESVTLKENGLLSLA